MWGEPVDAAHSIEPKVGDEVCSHVKAAMDHPVRSTDALVTL